jgi:hypothetical protein
MRRIGCALLFGLVACSGSSTTPDGTAAPDSGTNDATAPADATVQDAASSDVLASNPDSGTADAGTADSGSADATVTSTDTWTSYVQGFAMHYCVQCHGANDAARDYRSYDQFKRDDVEIRCGLAPTQLSGCTGFPPPAQFPIGNGPKPSDAERTRVVSWIEAGAAH